ncbi:unnamed protein product [Closterium sp. NIES-53]
MRSIRSAQALYDAVVARYSSLATAALGRLLLPYLFPELSAFAIVEDLVSHLRIKDACYRAALQAEFLDRNPPPMYITLYFIVTRLPDYLRADVGAASASAKRRSSKGKGGKGGGGGSGGGGGGSSGGSGGGGSSGSGGGSGGFGGGGGGSGGSGGNGSGGSSGDWTGAQRGEFGDEAERPRWAELLRSGVAIFDLDYDAIFAAMYALSVSAEGDCYQCVPPDPGIEAAALGASEFVLPGTAPAEALHTFTLDSGASHCFFRNSTTLTPLSAPVPVRLANPSEGPVLARSSTVLLCPTVPSGSLSRLHLPSFSTNVYRCPPGRDGHYHHSRGSACVDLHVYTDGSSLYTLATEPPQVAALAQVSESGQVAPPCSCRLLTHQTLLWHHRLGHPSLPRLRGMHSHLLVSGLPRSLPPLPPLPAPPCLPCVEGRQRAAPHSSSFPPTTVPLQTLHMEMWGPSCVNGQGRERYFPLVVDDYTRYTMVFPLRSKGQVVDVLIPWIRVVRLQLRERFRVDLVVLRLHSNRGGEFSSNLLRDFCRGEGILESFTLPDSPQQNGIAEHRIGLVMEIARTSMIHAAAPDFLWPFAVRYAAHQLNLWPRISLPETSPTLRWTGKVGDASEFRVWGSRAFVHDTSVDKLSARAIPFVFLGFSPDVPGWHRFPFTISSPAPPPPLFLAPGPHPVDPLPTQGPAPSGVSQVDPLPGTAPVEVAVGSGAARAAASGGAEPGAAESEGAGSGGAEPRGAEPGGAELAGVEPGGNEPEGVEPRGAESKGAESGGAEPRGTGARDSAAGDPGAGGAEAVVPGGARTRGTGAAGTAGGSGVGGAGARGARAVDLGSRGAGGTVRPRPYFVPLLQQILGLPSSTVLRLTSRSRRYSQPPHCLLVLLTLSRPAVLQSVVRLRLVLPPLFALVVAFLVSVSLLSQAHTLWHFFLPRFQCVFLSLLLLSPLFLPSLTLSLTALVLPGCTNTLVAELVDFAAVCRLDYATALVTESGSTSPPSIEGECALGTDVLEDRQEDFECLAAAVPRFASMLLAPEGDPDAPDIPTPRSYAEAITGTYVDAVPPSRANIVDGIWIFRVKRPPGSPPAFKARYVARGFSQRQGVDYFQTFSPTLKMTTLRVLLHVAAQRDYELHSLDFSTPFLQGSLHEEIWLRRPPGFTGSFPAGTHCRLRRPVYGLRQAPREWHNTLRTTLVALGFAPSIADTSLFLRTDTSLPPFYVLVYVDNLVFATADTKALTLVKSELQKRHTCTDLGELTRYLGLHITRDRARRTITLTQSHMVHQVLQRFGFKFSSPQPTPLSTSYSLSAPPLDESVEPSGPYPELVGCLMYLMTCTRPDLAYPLCLLSRYVAPGRHRKVRWVAAKRVLRYLCSTTGMGLVLGGRGLVVLIGHVDASWVDDSATQRSSQGYTFNLSSDSVSWWSTRSSLVLSSSCEAEIYAGAMAAQELRWLTYLLIDLGEQPCSPPVLYVDNKAMIAL